MSTISLAVCLAFAAAVVTGGPAPARSAEPVATAKEGRGLFQSRCGGCHTLDTNKTGPALRGVAGRRAGGAPAFRYSPALAGSGVIWTDAALDQWLAGPSKFVPGARMTARVTAPADRRVLIAYLRSLA